MGALDGRGALVTGGGGGFGRSSARLLAADGAGVVLMGRTAAKLAAARETLLAHHPDATIDTFTGNAAQDDDVAAAVDRVVERFGRIDAVVGTVGGSSGFGPIVGQTGAAFAADLVVNAVPAFLLVRYAAPRMVEGGSFVFISSTAARLSFRGLAGYCAGKAALDQFVKVAADELGPAGIRVNSIRPGLTRTDGLERRFATPGYVEPFLPLIPLGRTGEPDDIARLVRFLAGDEGSWVTGTSIPVDGGNELRGAPAL